VLSHPQIRHANAPVLFITKLRVALSRAAQICTQPYTNYCLRNFICRKQNAFLFGNKKRRLHDVVDNFPSDVFAIVYFFRGIAWFYFGCFAIA